MELDCTVQNYAWGKIGKTSEVASLREGGDPNFQVEETAPYAELWMGTHPNGPSVIRETGETLQSYISQNPEVLGASSRKIFGDNLPFLFKVLSVKKALSIQAHPNKEHALQLHAQRPEIYKDANHKPEMAIALTPFEGLCGFRPLSEIQDNLKKIPQLKAMIGAETCDSLINSNEENYSPMLKIALQDLMMASKDRLTSELMHLEQEIRGKAHMNADDRLFLQLCSQYPGDVGCFVLYLVNHVSLLPGEAMFLGPNLIHAYISGDCIECMACSDNVVRAGLTPKLIDVPTLCEMLDYTCKSGEEMKFEPKPESPVTTLYKPSVPDFAVAKHTVAGGSCATLPDQQSASIMLVVQGSGLGFGDGLESQEVKRGKVFFLKSGQLMTIENKRDEYICIFQAFC